MASVEIQIVGEANSAGHSGSNRPLTLEPAAKVRVGTSRGVRCQLAHHDAMRDPRLFGIQTDFEALTVWPFLNATPCRVNEHDRMTSHQGRLAGAPPRLGSSLGKVVGQDTGVNH